MLPPLMLPPPQLPAFSQLPKSRSLFFPAQPSACQTAQQLMCQTAQPVSPLEIFLSHASNIVLRYFSSLHKPKKPPLRSCQHNTRISRCRMCNGSAFCRLHGRRKETCKDCGGSSMCDHGIERRMCKRCKQLGVGGNSLCDAHCVKKGTCSKCKLQRKLQQ